jgi:hypothetical protein
LLFPLLVADISLDADISLPMCYHICVFTKEKAMMATWVWTLFLNVDGVLPMLESKMCYQCIPIIKHHGRACGNRTGNVLHVRRGKPIVCGGSSNNGVTMVRLSRLSYIVLCFHVSGYIFSLHVLVANLTHNLLFDELGVQWRIASILAII